MTSRLVAGFRIPLLGRGLRPWVTPVSLVLALTLGSSGVSGQLRAEWLPQSPSFPRFLAGPRDPVSSASLLGVLDNPDQHGPGAEVEVALGNSLPVLLLLRGEDESPLLLGIEAGVFARFGLQVLERELISTDWYFAVPALWPKEWGWIRFRYYHSSSHMGDEYIRRFEDPGVNFSRDAADLFAYHETNEFLGVYGGIRYGYNVHPEGSGQFVLRGGAELESPERGQALLPYLAADLEWDEDTTPDVRLDLRAGFWLPRVADRRKLRLALGFLIGPSPMAQFQQGNTTQVSIGLQGYF